MAETLFCNFNLLKKLGISGWINIYFNIRFLLTIEAFSRSAVEK